MIATDQARLSKRELLRKRGWTERIFWGLWLKAADLDPRYNEADSYPLDLIVEFEATDDRYRDMQNRRASIAVGKAQELVVVELGRAATRLLIVDPELADHIALLVGGDLLMLRCEAGFEMVMPKSKSALLKLALIPAGVRPCRSQIVIDLWEQGHRNGFDGKVAVIDNPTGWHRGSFRRYAERLRMK